MIEYVDRLGYDFTEWMTSDTQIELFNRMCDEQDKCNRPLCECYIHVADAINLEAEIKGKPKRAFIQAVN